MTDFQQTLPDAVQESWCGSNGAFAPTPKREPPPPHNGDETSVAAAESVAPFVGSIRERVFRFLAERGDYGATDQEIEKALAVNESTARARRIELRDAGRVTDSGRVRPTPSGRAAHVWIAARPILLPPPNQLEVAPDAGSIAATCNRLHQTACSGNSPEPFGSVSGIAT